MAVTLILPNGAELHSAASPYVMTEAAAARARARGPGQAVQAAAHAEAEALAQQLASNATPEALAKALGLPLLAAQGAAREERHRLLVDAARQAQGRPLTRDPLALLFRRGSLPAESFRAGQEIARVFLAIGAAVTPRVTASYGERVAQGPALEDWPVGLRTAYRDRYCPWRDWAGAQSLRRGSWAGKCRETLGDLTLLVAGEGWCCADAARHYAMDEARLLGRVRESLWWYALHAGWAQEGPALRQAAGP